MAWITDPPITLLSASSYHVPGAGTWARLEGVLIWQDDDGTAHIVPDQFIWNGSSIPRLLWGWIGHPFRNRYLRSSALHDWQCRERRDPSSVVHRRFYAGLRADGVSWLEAQAKWRGLQLGGPRW
jgi:hypothetical protein